MSSEESDDDCKSFVSGKSIGGSSAHACPYPNCDKFFGRPSRLKTHILSHTGGKPFKCTVKSCNKSYARNAHLKRHMEISHSEQKEALNERLPCQQCDSTFANKYSLAKHVQKSHVESKTEYVCDQCHLKFTKRKYLKQHRSDLHPNLVKPHQCQHCEKRFLYPTKLRQHIKYQHKTYNCQVCPESFDKWSLYRKHCKTHKKPRVCPECQKEFTNKSNYDKHLDTHREERTIVFCPVKPCKRFYTEEKNLKAHIQTYHEGLRLPCTVQGCNERFVSRGTRKRHLKTFHSAADQEKKEKVSCPRKPRKDKGFSKSSAIVQLSGIQLDEKTSKTLAQSAGKVVLDPQKLDSEIQKLNESSLGLDSDGSETETDLEIPDGKSEVLPIFIPSRQIAMESSSDDEESDVNENTKNNTSAEKKIDFSMFMM